MESETISDKFSGSIRYGQSIVEGNTNKQSVRRRRSSKEMKIAKLHEIDSSKLINENKASLIV